MMNTTKNLHTTPRGDAHPIDTSSKDMIWQSMDIAWKFALMGIFLLLLTAIISKVFHMLCTKASKCCRRPTRRNSDLSYDLMTRSHMQLNQLAHPSSYQGLYNVMEPNHTTRSYLERFPYHEYEHI